MTPEAIASMMSAVFDALMGKHGEAAPLAAEEAVSKLMADHTEKPVRH